MGGGGDDPPPRHGHAWMGLGQKRHAMPDEAELEAVQTRIALLVYLVHRVVMYASLSPLPSPPPKVAPAAAVARLLHTTPRASRPVAWLPYRRHLHGAHPPDHVRARN